MTSWEQAFNMSRQELLKQVGYAVKEQTADAQKLSPVDTGKLRSNWRSSGGGNHYRIENMTNYASFQEFGTHKQVGREMLGLRSERVAQDIVNKTLRHKF